MIFSAIFELLAVFCILPFSSALLNFDEIKNTTYFKFVNSIIYINDAIEFEVFILIVMIVILIIKNILLLLENYASSNFVFNCRYEMQKKMLASFLNKPYEYFLNASSPDLLRIIHVDIVQTYHLLLTITKFFSDIIKIIILIIFIIYISPFITLTAFIVLGIISLIIILILKPILDEKGELFRENAKKSYKWLLQTVAGIKEIKITRNEKYFADNYNNASFNQNAAEKSITIFNNLPRIFIELGSLITIAIVFLIMLYTKQNLSNMLPTFATLIIAAIRIIPLINRIINTVNTVAYEGKALDNVIKNISVLDNKGMMSNTQVFDEKSNSINIELKNISYSYPNNDKEVLSNVDLNISNGQIVGITGKTGEGKTTLINIVTGLLKPKTGKVLFNDKNILDNYNKYLSYIGYVPQTIFIMDDTIKENILFGNKYNDVIMEEVLKEVQLYNYVNSLSEKLDTFVGENGIKISGGQKQRIGIARVLYNDPKFIIFDEATASIDNETEDAIIDAINMLHGKKTIIIISHNENTLKYCDVIYKVENKGIKQIK